MKGVFEVTKRSGIEPQGFIDGGKNEPVVDLEWFDFAQPGPQGTRGIQLLLIARGTWLPSPGMEVRLAQHTFARGG